MIFSGPNKIGKEAEGEKKTEEEEKGKKIKREREERREEERNVGTFALLFIVSICGGRRYILYSRNQDSKISVSILEMPLTRTT